MKMAKREEIVNQSVRVDKGCQTFQSHRDGHVATANSCHTLQRQLVILVMRVMIHIHVEESVVGVAWGQGGG